MGGGRWGGEKGGEVFHESCTHYHECRVLLCYSTVALHNGGTAGHVVAATHAGAHAAGAGAAAAHTGALAAGGAHAGLVFLPGLIQGLPFFLAVAAAYAGYRAVVGTAGSTAQEVGGLGAPSSNHVRVDIFCDDPINFATQDAYLYDDFARVRDLTCFRRVFQRAGRLQVGVLEVMAAWTTSSSGFFPREEPPGGLGSSGKMMPRSLRWTGMRSTNSAVPQFLRPALLSTLQTAGADLERSIRDPWNTYNLHAATDTLDSLDSDGRLPSSGGSDAAVGSAVERVRAALRALSAAPAAVGSPRGLSTTGVRILPESRPSLPETLQRRWRSLADRVRETDVAASHVVGDATAPPEKQKATWWRALTRRVPGVLLLRGQDDRATEQLSTAERTEKEQIALLCQMHGFLDLLLSEEGEGLLMLDSTLQKIHSMEIQLWKTKWIRS